MRWYLRRIIETRASALCNCSRFASVDCSEPVTDRHGRVVPNNCMAAAIHVSSTSDWHEEWQLTEWLADSDWLAGHDRQVCAETTRKDQTSPATQCVCWSSAVDKADSIDAANSASAWPDSVNITRKFCRVNDTRWGCRREKERKRRGRVNGDGMRNESRRQQQRQRVVHHGAVISIAINAQQSRLPGPAAQGPQTDAGFLQRLHTPRQNTRRRWVACSVAHKQVL